MKKEAKRIAELHLKAKSGKASRLDYLELRELRRQLQAEDEAEGTTEPRHWWDGPGSLRSVLYRLKALAKAADDPAEAALYWQAAENVEFADNLGDELDPEAYEEAEAEAGALVF